MSTDEYCTASNFEISPGVFTHNLTVQQVEADAAYGCCQKFICGLPCPATFDQSNVLYVYGIPVAVAAGLAITLGLIASLKVKGDFKNYFVCSRTLPLWIVSLTLSAQGLDSNATLGNVVNGYKYGFWDGAVLPIGLGISLLLNGLFIAPHINKMRLLALPDLFARKYGHLMELLVCAIELVSFTFLIAGNLVGLGLIYEYVWGVTKVQGACMATTFVVLYVIMGGLYSIAYVDIPQVSIGFVGFIVTTIYVTTTVQPSAAPPSMGFTIDLGGNATASTPGYSGSPTCVNPVTNASTCDNYAYPLGDQMVYPSSMTSYNAYAPYPNAVVFNWATVIVLGLGNLCALDFQQRSMASKSPRVARWGNIIAACVLLGCGLPFSMLSSYVRNSQGPDSPYATFIADTCSEPLGLPTCAAWVPDTDEAFFNFLWSTVPGWVGAWCLIAVAAASMSTCDGAVLVCATVMANNVWRKVPKIGDDERYLLLVVRMFVLPMAAAALCVALFLPEPGKLLIIAFDVVFAGVLVPLVFAVYLPRQATPNAGVLSLLAGSITRAVLQFALPHDGSLVYAGTYALNYGLGLAGLPSFMIVDPPGAAEVWDTAAVPCEQTELKDWSGIDSLISMGASFFTMLLVVGLEHMYPNLDLLPFIPYSWRRVTPLYPDEMDDMDVPPGVYWSKRGIATENMREDEPGVITKDTDLASGPTGVSKDVEGGAGGAARHGPQDDSAHAGFVSGKSDVI